MLKYITRKIKAYFFIRKVEKVLARQPKTEGEKLLHFVFSSDEAVGVFNDHFSPEEVDEINAIVSKAIESEDPLVPFQFETPKDTSLEVAYLFDCYNGKKGQFHTQVAFGYLYDNNIAGFRTKIDSEDSDALLYG